MNNKSSGIFVLSNFYIIKLISDPLTLRPLCSSRFRPNKKCLVVQLHLGQNLLKNVLNRKTFLNWQPLLGMDHILCTFFPQKYSWGSLSLACSLLNSHGALAICNVILVSFGQRNLSSYKISLHPGENMELGSNKWISDVVTKKAIHIWDIEYFNSVTIQSF